MQGFASGDCERDGAAIQRFLEKGLAMALSQSYAKNMGMYGQRSGALSIVCADPKEAAAVESQVKAVARAMYSNPPCHGAYLVHEILSDAKLKQQWCAASCAWGMGMFVCTLAPGRLFCVCSCVSTRCPAIDQRLWQSKVTSCQGASQRMHEALFSKSRIHLLT